MKIHPPTRQPQSLRQTDSYHADPSAKTDSPHADSYNPSTKQTAIKQTATEQTATKQTAMHTSSYEQAVTILVWDG